MGRGHHLNVGVVHRAALLTRSPAVGKLLRGGGALPSDFGKVGGGFVVVGAEQAGGLAEVPAGDADSAVVVRQVAGDLDAVVVVDAQRVAHPVDGGVCPDDGQL